MQPQELSTLAWGRTDQIKQALRDGNMTLASKLGKKLPKDYALMLHGMRKIVEASMAWVETDFAAQVQKLGENVLLAIGKNRMDDATRLLDEKSAQFRPFHERYVEFFASVKRETVKQFGGKTPQPQDVELTRRTLALHPAERIKQALREGNMELASELAWKLPKDYTLMLQGMRKTVEGSIAWVEGEFGIQQQKLSDDIMRAIAENRSDDAIRLLDQKTEQFRPFHDRYVEFFALLKSETLKQFGPEKLLELLRGMGEQLRPVMFDGWAGMEVPERLQAMVFTMHSHLGRLSVEEDSERFTIVNDACGSGGRLLREGWYDRPDGLSRLAEPHAMTMCRSDFQSYCTHCPTWLGAMAIEFYGFPLWVVDPPRVPSDVCRIHIYKDPDRIPKDYLHSIGKATVQSK